MTLWKRDTPWRQGMCLSEESAQLFFGDLSSGSAVVIISHDCDLAQSPDVEPFVEVIIGRRVPQADGNYTNIKNLRRLHLPCTAGSQPVTVELIATGKELISKQANDEASLGLADHQPDPDVRLKPEELRILQMWLAARYRRAAFPDEFDRRLKSETKLAERLGRLCKDTGSDIAALFFEVDSYKQISHSGSDDPYDLRIFVLYSTHLDPRAAESVAKSVASQIEVLFAEQCQDKTTKVWKWIELAGVEVLSDEVLTYAMSQRLMKWQADHISLRAKPEQPLYEIS